MPANVHCGSKTTRPLLYLQINSTSIGQYQSFLAERTYKESPMFTYVV